MESIDSTAQSPIQWGLYPWFTEHSTELIHPEDLDSLQAFSPYGKVFEVIGRDEDYIFISYGGQTFRVKPTLFQPVPRPAKRIGDVVRVQLKGKTELGIVVEVQWHHQKSEPFYIIEIEGKLSSKRYWHHDFYGMDE